MGRAYYKFYLSTTGMMLGGSLEDGQMSFQDIEVNRIHSQLPFKTKLVSVEKVLGENSIMISMVAIFEHPIFIDDTEIKELTEYRRSIGFSLPETSSEYNIYTYNKTDNLNFDEFIRMNPPEEVNEN